MAFVDPASLLDHMQWRYAVQRFDAARKIPAATWQALEDATILSPSSFGIHPWQLIVVEDPAIRARLQPATCGQTQTTEASHLVVFASWTSIDAARVDHYLARIAAVRGVPAGSLEGFGKAIIGSVGAPGYPVHAWAEKQAYIGLGVFLTAAAALGVDACPMEGFEPDKYDEILGLSAQGLQTTVLATAGYRHPDDKFAALAKVRYVKDEIVKRV
ncbi:MAG TPA: NAD(P)H-dependent oxidoreductase [Planctomycetia bacterium]|nr:NAD(P)H-dependent oxidoreductase [Planctomycetia bacterium]